MHDSNILILRPQLKYSREVEGELMQPRHCSESVTKFRGKEDKEISTRE